MPKGQQNKEQKATQIVPKISPKGEPRAWFSHPKLHPGGPLGPQISKTPPARPQDASKPRSLCICMPSGLICGRYVVHIFKNGRSSCSLVCVRECIFHQNIENEAIKWVGAQPTFLARWRVCRRHLEHILHLINALLVELIINVLING